MAAIDFPTSPSSGQLYTVGARIWQWNGLGWQRVVNANQIVSVFTLFDYVNFTEAPMPYTIDGSWTQLIHL